MWDLADVQHHQGERLRLYDLLKGPPTKEGATLDGHRFDDCDIEGPAMIVVTESLAMQVCSFDEKPQMFLIELSPSEHPDGIVGVISLRNVSFTNCRFKLVGIIGGPSIIAMARKGFGLPSPN